MDKPVFEVEHDDLPFSDDLACEALGDVLGMGVCIHVSLIPNIQTFVAMTFSAYWTS